jgi:hypothetical protein
MKSFISGLGLGALVGLLIAPAEGRETRQNLKRGAQQVRREGRRTVTRSSARLQGLRAAFREAGARMAQRPGGSGPRRVARLDQPLSFLNHASRQELMAVKGIGEVLAAKIMKGRPYESESDVLANKDLPPSVLELISAGLTKAKAS